MCTAWDQDVPPCDLECTMCSNALDDTVPGIAPEQLNQIRPQQLDRISSLFSLSKICIPIPCSSHILQKQLHFWPAVITPIWRTVNTNKQFSLTNLHDLSIQCFRDRKPVLLHSSRHLPCAGYHAGQSACLFQCKLGLVAWEFAILVLHASNRDLRGTGLSKDSCYVYWTFNTALFHVIRGCFEKLSSDSTLSKKTAKNINFFFRVS